MDVTLKVVKVGSVLHPNQPVVGKPFGFTASFNVAPPDVMEVAAFLVTEEQGANQRYHPT